MCIITPALTPNCLPCSESYVGPGARSPADHRLHPSRHPHPVQGPHHWGPQATLLQLQALESLLHHVRLEVSNETSAVL